MLPLLLLILLTPIPSSSAAPSIAKPGCVDHCGNVTIPYPFGVGPNCFFNPWYDVICNVTSDPPTPYLAALKWNHSTGSYYSTVEIIDISTDPITTDNYLGLTVRAPNASADGLLHNGSIDFREMVSLDMRNSPFQLAPQVNTLASVGCGGSAVLGNRDNEILVGCTNVCPGGNPSTSNSTLLKSSNSSCYGNGCCQTSVPTFLDYFSVCFGSSGGGGDSFSSKYISVVNNSIVSRLNSSVASSFDLGTILKWKFRNGTVFWPDSLINNSDCRISDESGYVCSCKQFYEGNPLLDCQVVEECQQCPNNCTYAGTRYKCNIAAQPFVIHNKSELPIALGLGISLGSVTLAVILYGLFLLVNERKEIRQRQINFKKNGGLLLDQQMTTREGAFERSKVFTYEELKRATDNFHESRVLGRGGQGTVYKGMLLDGTIVAIKKSKQVDASQLGQFINEVVILSQINHRNVVKLFGCCLETEVPLLVYEFVLNDTLFRHIHNPKEDLRITWKMRLQIAIESAEALRYLHSSSSTPIYHRDIKTSNILLDERYRAKIADFGISRTVSIDQTHVTTNVQGTFGYIDPQYFQSHQFTEKSDVYSFGVVLLELLTSKKPVYVDKDMDPRSLASEFLLCMQQSRLCDLVDADVLQEAQMGVIEGVADLAKRCLSLNGNMRPTMHEVSMTLQSILAQNDVPHSSSEHVVNNGKKDQM